MTRQNINYYNIFIRTIKLWDMIKLIYIYESHFDRGELCSKYGWSKTRKSKHLIDQSSLDGFRFNVIMLMSLDPPNGGNPCYIEASGDNNTSSRFIQFIKTAYD